MMATHKYPKPTVSFGLTIEPRMVGQERADFAPPFEPR
jgi:hypothetical protein